MASTASLRAAACAALSLCGLAGADHAGAQQSPDCAPAWNVTHVYVGGDLASQDHINYLANWWTQGDEPASHNGPPGSAQPWTAQGACAGDGGGGPPSGIDPIFANGFDGVRESFLFSPYKDATINMDWNSNRMRTAVLGSPIPLVGSGGLLPQHVPDLHAVTLAFATGECGSENWGGVGAQAFADANIAALANAGIDYVISTGGAAGAFTCASSAGLNQFIARYASPQLRGIDFDIEAGQTPAQLQALVDAAAGAEATHPGLRFSFTLATLAASDGSHGGVNATGDAVVRAVLGAGLSNYTINLMVMDYGAAGPAVCVVSGGICDMGASAIQAAQNLAHTYGVPLDRIELTPMIGLNDVVSETFTLADVDTLSAWARSNGLAGVHYWSLDRDTPCAVSTGSASPICHSVTGLQPLAYTLRFVQATRATTTPRR